MPDQTDRIRIRFFVAVEGESEGSFVKWLQRRAEGIVHIHLEGVPLGGGGFKSMLEKAVRLHKRHCRTGAYKARFLIVDGDRAEQGDWSIDELRREASRHKITVCVQKPKHEGLLFRMMPGKEREIPDAVSVETKLKRLWPNYQKPVNAYTLNGKFSLDDLLRVAQEDSDLAAFLKTIGLM